MPPKKRLTWKSLLPGDAFEIPVNNGKKALGVVADNTDDLYIVVYEEIYDINCSIDLELVRKESKIMFAGRTTDEMFYHRKWERVGRIELGNFPRPYYVVGTDCGECLKDFYGRLIRLVQEGDLEKYGRRVNVSNLAFIKGINKIHGLGDEDFDLKRIDAGMAWVRSTLEG